MSAVSNHSSYLGSIPKMRTELNHLVAEVNKLEDDSPILASFAAHYQPFIQSVSPHDPMETILNQYRGFLLRLAQDGEIADHPMMQTIRGWLKSYGAELPPMPLNSRIEREIDAVLRQQDHQVAKLQPALITVANFNSSMDQIMQLASSRMAEFREQVSQVHSLQSQTLSRIEAQEAQVAHLRLAVDALIEQTERLNGQVDEAIVQRIIIQQKLAAAKAAAEEKPSRNKGLFKACLIVAALVITGGKIGVAF